jgi:hypothetical protein
MLERPVGDNHQSRTVATHQTNIINFVIKTARIISDAVGCRTGAETQLSRGWSYYFRSHSDYREAVPPRKRNAYVPHRDTVRDVTWSPTYPQQARSVQTGERPYTEPCPGRCRASDSHIPCTAVHDSFAHPSDSRWGYLLSTCSTSVSIRTVARAAVSVSSSAGESAACRSGSTASRYESTTPPRTAATVVGVGSGVRATHSTYSETRRLVHLASSRSEFHA